MLNWWFRSGFWPPPVWLSWMMVSGVVCVRNRSLWFSHVGGCCSACGVVSLRTPVRFVSLMSAFGISRLGPLPIVVTYLHMDSSLSRPSFTRLDSPFSMFGRTRFRSSCSILDSVPSESFSSLRNFDCFDSALSTFGISRFDSPTLAVDSVHAESPSFACYFARFGHLSHFLVVPGSKVHIPF